MYILIQGDNIVALPGTKRMKYLEENLGGVDVQLTSKELLEIRKIIDSIDVAGTRYDDNNMKVRIFI